jgi:hypothetical protein
VRKRKILFESLAVVVLCLLFALAMSVSLTAAQETETSEQAPSFNGVWERNPDESDDPREKMQEALGGQTGQMGRGGGEGGRPGGGGRRQHGMGGQGGTPGRGGARRGGSEKMQAMRETMKEAMRAVQTLEISLSETELRIVDGSDNVRIYYLDGEKHKRQTPGGVDLETVAQKRGDRIIIEEKAESAKFTRTFALAQDGSVMVVTVRLENDRFKQPVVIRSVYDPLRDSEIF